MKKIFNKMNKLRKRKRIGIFVSITLVLSFIIIVILLNKSYASMEKYTEVSFVTPKEAIVFWKSKKNALGYVKYSDKKFGKYTTVLQTSSEPRNIHVVYLENIPTKGIYIKKYVEGGFFLIFPKIQHIKYNSNTDERL